ncbi:histidinol phosphatase [Pyrodictium occultum]|uniref:Histidinol phosphatase n=1 Tax=Pyrodictium occultum TaxID=2309 RepID=A0A0V8RXL2_PYROC|nr:PHP domain-containing protein [Pyrodictium occultum]KSW12690.1 histidinol phosphatase [Pyrodictium occultum]
MRLRADMHVHTTVSDGRNSPEEVLIAAVEKELDVIAVTDHDTFEGGLRALRAARSMSLDLVVVPGAEVRTTAGDVLVYCSDEPLERIPRDPLELADVAHDNGCLVAPAHPFDTRRAGIGELVYHGSWDALEVYNARSDPASNQRAERAARELGIPGLANSDAHLVDELGAAYSIIDAEEKSPESVLEAIRAGRVKPVHSGAGRTSAPHPPPWELGRRARRGGPSRLDYLEDLGPGGWL